MMSGCSRRREDMGRRCIGRCKPSLHLLQVSMLHMAALHAQSCSQLGPAFPHLDEGPAHVGRRESDNLSTSFPTGLVDAIACVFHARGLHDGRNSGLVPLEWQPTASKAWCVAIGAHLSVSLQIRTHHGPVARSKACPVRISASSLSSSAHAQVRGQAADSWAEEGVRL